MYQLDLLLYSGNDFLDGNVQDEIQVDLVKNHILRYFSGLEEKQIYCGSEVLSKYFAGNYLAFSWGCQISADLLKEVRFLEGIMAEDALFAPILISKSKRLESLEIQYYKSRIRPFSITDFGNQHTKKSLPQSLGDICEKITKNIEAKNYYLAYSCVCICYELYSYFYIQKHCDKEVWIRVNDIILGRIPMAFGALHFESDPRNAREKLKELEDYLKNVGLGSKLAYHYPRVFRMLKKIKTLIRG